METWYEGPDPEELVDALLGRGRWRELSVEQAAEVAHAVRSHVQVVWCLEEALEDRVRAIAAGRPARPAVQEPDAAASWLLR